MQAIKLEYCGHVSREWTSLVTNTIKLEYCGHVLREWTSLVTNNIKLEYCGHVDIFSDKWSCFKRMDIFMVMFQENGHLQ